MSNDPFKSAASATIQYHADYGFEYSTKALEEIESILRTHLGHLTSEPSDEARVKLDSSLVNRAGLLFDLLCGMKDHGTGQVDGGSEKYDGVTTHRQIQAENEQEFAQLSESEMKEVMPNAETQSSTGEISRAGVVVPWVSPTLA
jgi:hypothetical protein